MICKCNHRLVKENMKIESKTFFSGENWSKNLNFLLDFEFIYLYIIPPMLLKEETLIEK